MRSLNRRRRNTKALKRQSLRGKSLRSKSFGGKSLQLETLDQRLLLSVAANWVANDYPADFVGPPEPDFLASGDFLDPENWDNPLSYIEETGFSLPSVVSINEDTDFNSDHPFNCCCPMCSGLADSQATTTDSDQIFSDYLASGGDSDPTSGDSQATTLLSASSYVLYLDFDGGTVESRSGDFWLGSASIQIPAFDLSNYGWSGREAEAISYITDFIQEDYAAYNVTVTTTEPLSGDYTTMYVGGNNDWFRSGSGVIGVATYDINNSNPSNYGFAFSDELGIYYNYSGGDLQQFSEYLSNLISHEAGHTFGANHVTNTTAIMNPYLPISPRRLMFGQGQIPGSTSSQDTQSLLASNLGYADSADDFGDSVAQAQSITVETTIDGLLERRDDVDVFTFTPASSGILTIDIDTDDFGNLDSLLNVYRTNDMAVLAVNDNYLGARDSYSILEVQQGFQYAVCVSSANANSSGSYSLALALEQDGPEADLVITDDLNNPNDHVLDFSAIYAGAQSSATFTISNHGSADLTISELTATGSFGLDVSSQPGWAFDDLAIAPGGQQNVTVTFAPGQTGSYNGSVKIVTNDPDEPTTSILLTGTAQAPVADLSGLDAVDFGDIDRGQTGSQIVTISNAGLAELTINNVFVDSPFVIVSGFDNQALTIAPGATHDFVVEVTAQQRGHLDGNLTIVSSDPDEPIATVELDAQICAGALCIIENSQTANDNQIDFGSVRVGETVEETFTLVNSGDGRLIITGLTVEGGFVLDTNLDAGLSGDDLVLQAGESVIVTAFYNPAEIEEVSGVVTIITDEVESAQSEIMLQAAGVGSVLEISEADGLDDNQFDAGTVKTGAVTQFVAYELTNFGNAAVTVNLALAEGSAFSLVSPQSIIVGPGESYEVQLQLQTALARTVNDTLYLTADDIDETEEQLTLAGDAYAVVGGGERYSFVDHSGDKVTITLSGSARAAVTLGNGQQSDIQSISFLEGDESGKSSSLSIKVQGGGSTSLGEISGSAQLRMISAGNVHLMGSGIDLEGSLGALQIGSVLSGADIRFSADQPALMRVEQIVGDSDIDIDGELRMLSTSRFTGGSLRAESIAKIMASGSIDANIEASEGGIDNVTVRDGNLDGSVTAQGNLGSVNVLNGDLRAALNSDNDISRIMARSGSVSSSIKAGGDINMIQTQNIENATIFARREIKTVNVSNNLLDSLISIGFDHDEYPEYSAGATAQVEASLGSLSVRGTFSATTVAVGVAPDEQGDFINGSAISASGTIGKVTLRNIDTENETMPFGLVAKDDISRLVIARPTSAAANHSEGNSYLYHEHDFYVNVLT